MKKGLIKIFINEAHSPSLEKNSETNKTMIKSIDDSWSLDLLNISDFGPKSNRGYRYVLVVIDNFSKLGWTIPLKNNYTQSITDTFSKIIKSSNRKPNLLKTDDGKEYVNKIFNDFFNKNTFKRYSRYTDKGAVFAEHFNRTIKNLLKKPVFEKGNGNWLSELSSGIKKCNNTIQNSTKMKPIDVSKKAKEKIVFSNLQDRGVGQQPMFKLGQLFRTADIKRVLSKGDSLLNLQFFHIEYTLLLKSYTILILHIESITYPRDTIKTYHYLVNYLLKKTIKLLKNEI